jgi:predicted RNA-binding protein
MKRGTTTKTTTVEEEKIVKITQLLRNRGNDSSKIYNKSKIFDSIIRRRVHSLKIQKLAKTICIYKNSCIKLKIQAG